MLIVPVIGVAVAVPVGQGGSSVSGLGFVVVPHSHTKMPPLTPGCPKWIWDCTAGPLRPVQVSLKLSDLPSGARVAVNVPLAEVNLGKFSWKPVILAVI